MNHKTLKTNNQNSSHPYRCRLQDIVKMKLTYLLAVLVGIPARKQPPLPGFADFIRIWLITSAPLVLLNFITWAKQRIKRQRIAALPK